MDLREKKEKKKYDMTPLKRCTRYQLVCVTSCPWRVTFIRSEWHSLTHNDSHMSSDTQSRRRQMHSVTAAAVSYNTCCLTWVKGRRKHILQDIIFVIVMVWMWFSFPLQKHSIWIGKPLILRVKWLLALGGSGPPCGRLRLLSLLLTGYSYLRSRSA